MARLIRTEKEVEGNFEEVWLVVEEDPLRAVAGGTARRRRPAGRAEGRARARTRRGALHGGHPASGDAACRGPAVAVRARTREVDRPRTVRSRFRACAARSGRARRPGSSTRRATPARPSRPWRPRRSARRAPRWTRSRSSGSCSKPSSTRRRRSSAGQCTVRRSGTSAATSTAPWRRPTSSSKGRTAHRSSCTTRWRRTSPCANGSATGSTSTRRRSTSGACATRWPGSSGSPPDRVRVVCEYMGGGFGSKNSAGEYTFVAAELARRTGRPVRCALTRREENIAAGNRNATIQKLTAARQQRRDDRGPGRRLRERARLGRLVGGNGGADEDAVRVRQRAHGAPHGEDQHAADEGLPRARVRRRDVRARMPDRPAGPRARRRPARAAAQELRVVERRHALLLEEPRASATSARRSTGTGATRCTRARTRHGSAASAWRARSGTAAAARRRTRGRVSAPTGASPSCTAMQDIGTGTRTAMAQIAAEELGVPLERVEVDARRHVARGPYATLSAARRRRRRWGPPFAQPLRTRSGRCSRSRRSGTTSRSAFSTSATAASSPRTATCRSRWTSSSRCSGTRRSSARAHVARIRPE